MDYTQGMSAVKLTQNQWSKIYEFLKEQQPYDEHLYGDRNLVERYINKMKHYRHIFSRFDKLASVYLGFLHFVSSLIWLK